MELNLILAAIFFLSCVLTTILFIKTYAMREYPGAICFSMLMLSLTVWMLFQGLELLSFSFILQILFSKLSYIGIVFVAPLVFSFVYGYINKMHWKEFESFGWIFLIPIAILGLVMTNEQHHLIWTSIEVSDVVPRLIYHHGVGVIAFAIYSYLLVGISFFLLLSHAFHQKSLFRNRLIWLFLAALIPLISSVLYIFQLTPIDNLDLSAIAVTISCVICAFTIYKYQLFEIRPIAYQALFDQMPGAVIAIDNQKRLIFANPSVNKWFHISEFDTSKNIFSLLPVLKKEWIQSFDTPFEFSIQYPAQVAKYFELTSHGLTTKSGNKRKTGTLIIISDITHRKWQENQIVHKENILAKFLEISRYYISSNSLHDSIQSSLSKLGELFKVDRVYIFQNEWDAVSKRILVSQKWEWASDTVTSEIGNQSLQSIDYQEFMPDWFAFLEQGKYVLGHVENLSTLIKQNLSSQNIQSILLQPIMIRERFWGFIGFDACHQKREWTNDEINSIGIASSIIGEFIDHSTTQLELQHSQKRFDQVTELAHEVFWETDNDGFFTYISPYVRNILGYEPDFLTKNMKFLDLLKPEKDNQQSVVSLIQELFKSKSSINDFQIAINSKDESTLYCIVNALPIYENGDFIGYRGSAFDISELKRLEKMKNDFISTVSHELRTPLTAIKESIHIVADGLAGEINRTQKDTLEIGMRNITRLSRIINNVLDFQKQNTGKIIYTPLIVNPNSLLKEAFETMKLHANEKSLEMKWQVHETLPAIYADADLIMQVLINLLHNAIKFTDKGYVGLDAFQENDTLHIIVKDTGIGIKKEDIKKLFQSFSQINTDNQASPGGSGLGLAISKQIITWHNGEIWVESDIGQGSEFHVRIPIHQKKSKEIR